MTESTDWLINITNYWWSSKSMINQWRMRVIAILALVLRKMGTSFTWVLIEGVEEMFSHITKMWNSLQKMRKMMKVAPKSIVVDGGTRVVIWVTPALRSPRISPGSMNLLPKKSTSMKIRGLTGVKDLFFLVKVFHIGNYNHLVTGACLFIDSSKFIFSKLFSTHLLWLVRKIVWQSIASLVGNHFLYTRELNVWLRGDIVRGN